MIISQIGFTSSVIVYYCGYVTHASMTKYNFDDITPALYIYKVAGILFQSFFSLTIIDSCFGLFTTFS